MGNAWQPRRGRPGRLAGCGWQHPIPWEHATLHRVGPGAAARSGGSGWRALAVQQQRGQKRARAADEEQRQHGVSSTDVSSMSGSSTSAGGSMNSVGDGVGGGAGSGAGDVGDGDGEGVTGGSSNGKRLRDDGGDDEPAQKKARESGKSKPRRRAPGRKTGDQSKVAARATGDGGE